MSLCVCIHEKESHDPLQRMHLPAQHSLLLPSQHLICFQNPHPSTSRPCSLGATSTGSCILLAIAMGTKFKMGAMEGLPGNFAGALRIEVSPHSGTSKPGKHDLRTHSATFPQRKISWE